MEASSKESLDGQVSKLTPEQISDIIAGCLRGNISYTKTVLSNPKLTDGFDLLSNYPTIEIGPGGNPIAKFYDCKSYIGVQPFECFVDDPLCKEYHIEDGLSFLRKQPDKSSVIVSIGVIDEDVLNYNDTKEGRAYMQELCNEIKRVSYPFCIVVASHAEKFMGEPNIGTDHIFPGGIYINDEINFEELLAK